TTLPAGAASYSWTGPNGFVSSLQNPSINNATLPASGNYVVIVTLTGGCSATLSTNVTVNPNPMVSATNSGSVCVGQNASLFSQPSGAASYNWSGPNGFTSNSQNSTVNAVNLVNAGSYSVTITLSTGCSSTTQTSLFVNSNPTVIASSNGSLCSGQNLILSSLPANGQQYNWTGPNNFSSSQQNPILNTVSTLASGLYSVTITQSNGCSGTSQISVVVNPNPTVSSSSNGPVCDGQSLSLNSLPAGGASYLWTGPGGFSSTLQNPTISYTNSVFSGLYSVTVTLPSGCKGSSQTNVVINPNPIISMSSNAPVCAGQNIALSVSPSGALSYNWTGPNNFTSFEQNPLINNATVLENGQYSVSISDNHGCFGSSSLNVVVNAIPSSAFTSTPLNCYGDVSTLTYSGNNTPSTQYTWTFSGGNATPGVNAGVQNVSWPDAGSHTVGLTVTQNGCTSSQTEIVVNNPTRLTSELTHTDIICYGQNDGQIDASISGGTIPYSFYWSNQMTTEDIFGLTSGLYSVTVTDSKGCTVASLVAINEPSFALSVAISQVQTICFGQVATINASASGGVGPNYMYLWSNMATTSSISINPVENTSFTVIVTDENGCTAMNSTSVFVSPPLNVSLIKNTNNVCSGNPVVLETIITGGIGAPYLMYNQEGQIVTPPIIVYPNTTSEYWVTVFDGCGAHDSGSVVIDVQSSPPVDVQVDILRGCQPLTVHFNEINTTDGRSFAWDFQDNGSLSLAQNPIHTFKNADTYYVNLTVTSQYGCKSHYQIPMPIVVYPKPEIQFTWTPEFATEINPEISFHNMTTDADIFIWNFSDGNFSTLMNPMHNFPGAGTYPVELIAISNMGCKDSAVFPLLIKEEFTFYAPSAFSPDNNQINDDFYIFAHGIKETNFFLGIYNRWGEEIWNTGRYDVNTELSEKWDGRSKGNQLMPVGTYVWHVKFDDQNGNTHEKTGSVSIVK
ncbi:MAG: hypothetical protein CVU05_11850, partial [Bacteroidetes bacterium HGW-Bacteroidetes-21]